MPVDEKRYNIRVIDKEVNEAMDYAKQKGLPYSEVIRIAITAWWQNERRGQTKLDQPDPHQKLLEMLPRIDQYNNSQINLIELWNNYRLKDEDLWRILFNAKKIVEDIETNPYALNALKRYTHQRGMELLSKAKKEGGLYLS